LPVFAYADDIKIVAKVTDATDSAKVQDAVTILERWSRDNRMPLSLEKCSVLHRGRNNPCHVYSLCGQPMMPGEVFVDLGITRSNDCAYSQHITSVITRGRRAAGAILHAFSSRDCDILWPAFVAYVKPIVMYGSCVWNPPWIGQIQQLEKIQRRFTKKLNGLHNLTYVDRLEYLNSLSLSVERTKADLVMVYKCIHRKNNVRLEDLGLSFSNNNERSGCPRLQRFCAKPKK
jgi:ribonucleases P/MRP protein subunit RPP40